MSKKPNIVIVDGFTANSGDLSWEAFARLGNLQIFDRTGAGEIVPRICEADAVITNKVPMTREIIGKAPHLRYIGLLSTGYNIVDLAATAERGIIVSNVPTYATEAVAQHTLALLLELTNAVALHSADVHALGWSRSQDYSYRLAPLRELQSLTMGLIGFGRIAEHVGKIAHALGMKILATRRNVLSTPPPPDYVCYAALDEVLAQSDVISLHCPLTDETQKLINEKTLGLMKPTAFLINTARGGLIEETALAKALKENRLAGFAADVLSTEPPAENNPLLGAPRCIITPHIAWAAKETRQRLLNETAENLAAFLRGTPRNTVPPA